jgi:hypothetical protein
MEKERNDIWTNEILSFWLTDNYINFEVTTDTGIDVKISIHSYEFLQWFDKNTIDEIKTKLIENIKTK